MNVNGDSVANIAINSPMERVATVTEGSNNYYAAFVVTETGLRFAQPLNINGIELQSLTYDVTTNKFTADGVANVDFTFYKAPGYKPISFYEGTWQFYNADGASLIWNLKPDENNRTLTATCDKYPWPLKFSYNIGSGTISLLSQMIGTYKLSDGITYYIALCAYSEETGYFSWASNTGMKCILSDDGNTLQFNGEDSSIGTVTSFFTVAFTSSTPSNNTFSMDATSELQDYFLMNINKMVRIK